MNGKPKKRGLAWFGIHRPGAPKTPNPPITPNTPNTLGKMWRQEPSDRSATDSWLLREPQAAGESPQRQNDPEPYPKLPLWPPQREYDRFAERSAGDERAGPAQTQPGVPESRRGGLFAGRLRTLWWKVTTGLRGPRLALVIGVSAIALCSLLGVAALGANLLHNRPISAHATPGAGSANGALVSPTAGEATPSAIATTTVTPGNSPTPSPLTITFTCASGTAGGAGQLCVSTLPHAALSVSVRYCDGSYAKGKAFHGVDYADGSGAFTWRWNVNTTCLGAATATVTAKLAGQSVTQSTTFTVTR